MEGVSPEFIEGLGDDYIVREGKALTRYFESRHLTGKVALVIMAFTMEAIKQTLNMTEEQRRDLMKGEKP